MIPAGCSQKSQLSGHINISHTRIYDLATLPDFPKPAGYYTYKNKKQQQAPYFNIAEVKAFAEKNLRQQSGPAKGIYKPGEKIHRRKSTVCDPGIQRPRARKLPYTQTLHQLDATIHPAGPMSTQHTKTGDYIITFYNKYGAILKDLSETAKTLEQAKDMGERRQFNVDDISQDETHHLPVAFSVDRRIYNSGDAK
jgi:hypothetical protein